MQRLLNSVYIVRNKAKRRISKQVSQENKARQIFRKTKICSFFVIIWSALFSWSTRFEIHPFALLPTICYVYSLEAYSEPSQTSKMVLLAKLVSGLKPLFNFAKASILNAKQGCEYVCVDFESVFFIIFSF